jgi:hypothetical protein
MTKTRNKNPTMEHTMMIIKWSDLLGDDVPCGIGDDVETGTDLLFVEQMID